MATFYVDELSTKNRPGFATRPSWNWCHLATDGGVDELHAFAESLGIDRAFYHGPGQLDPKAPQGHVPYYDISPGERLAALRAAASSDVVVIAVTSRELIARVRGGAG